ncbi:hypothetical protein CALCODRAFT_506739 [Calocera cornea HHB12733]|uniref:BZIP domain-containing protein n=1 Tax=Calocera cornea HHB12733 TaxID=1353952 RepID=A0A165IJJ1_9BASI|nr:hypothetical protein CALCODRAFT_506739 [Calocera cornea HHB12733]
MSQYANSFFNYNNTLTHSTAQWAQAGITLGGFGQQQQQTSSPTSPDEQAPASTAVKSELASLFGSYADMRAGHEAPQAGEMTLDDIFDLSFLSDSESTGIVDASGTSAGQGVTDSSSLASQLQLYLSQLYPSGATLESIEQPVTITPDEIWRDSTPTYVPPSAFDLPVPSPITSELAGGGNYSSASNPSVQPSAEPTANPTSTGTPMMGNAAPGPPEDDSSASPALDIEIKTEPDLEDEDGRPIRALPNRAAKSRRRIPLDAPIQPRNYNGPSRTAAKPLPKGFEKVLPAAKATSLKRKLEADDEEEEESGDDEEIAELVKNIKDKVALKRAKNTLAARKSRARKAAYTDELEHTIADRESRIADLERQIRERDVEIRLLKELRYPDGL